jgi:hypothetical protein
LNAGSSEGLRYHLTSTAGLKLTPIPLIATLAGASGNSFVDEIGQIANRSGNCTFCDPSAIAGGLLASADDLPLCFCHLAS